MSAITTGFEGSPTTSSDRFRLLICKKLIDCLRGIATAERAPSEVIRHNIFRRVLLGTLTPAALRRNLLPILVLALPVMLLSTLITAALVYCGIGHPRGFPWVAALLKGALLLTTTRRQ